MNTNKMTLVTRWHCRFGVAFLIAVLSWLTGAAERIAAAPIPDVEHHGNEHLLYVSPTGDDRAEGTQEAPFRTLYRAQEAARALCKEMRGDIVVNLAPGNYRLNHTLEFTEADSGRNGFDVIYRSSAGPGKARLLGSVLLKKGWQPYRNGIWKIYLPPKTLFYTLYENGIRAHMARFPNYEYNPRFPTALGKYLVTVHGSPRPNGKPNPKSLGWLVYPPGVVLPITNVTTMKLEIYPGGKEDWHREIHAVTSIDPQTRRLTFAVSPIFGVYARARFFLEDELEFLNARGEFFVNETAHTLYYMPEGQGNPDALDISYPVLNRIIQFQGKSREQCVQHLKLEGLALEESDGSPQNAAVWNDDMRVYDAYRHDGALIWMNNTAHVEIRNCHLKDSGRNGIMLMGNNTDDLITGCWIEHMGLNGVCLCNHFLAADGKSATADQCEHNRIYDTHISHVGELQTYAECVGVFNASSNEVDHCVLDNSVRYGVTMRGNTGAQRGPPIYTAFPPSKGNWFHHLLIARCGQDGGDMGALHAASLNNPGGDCVNTFEQIVIADTAAIASMKDRPPNGIFLDWPRMAMDQIFRNILIVRSQGVPFRSNGVDNGASAQTENVSWKPGFRENLMDFADIGLTSEFPAAYGNRLTAANYMPNISKQSHPTGH